MDGDLPCTDADTMQEAGNEAKQIRKNANSIGEEQGRNLGAIGSSSDESKSPLPPNAHISSSSFAHAEVDSGYSINPATNALAPIFTRAPHSAATVRGAKAPMAHASSSDVGVSSLKGNGIHSGNPSGLSQASRIAPNPQDSSTQKYSMGIDMSQTVLRFPSNPAGKLSFSQRTYDNLGPNEFDDLLLQSQASSRGLPGSGLTTLQASDTLSNDFLRRHRADTCASHTSLPSEYDSDSEIESQRTHAPDPQQFLGKPRSGSYSFQGLFSRSRTPLNGTKYGTAPGKYSFASAETTPSQLHGVNIAIHSTSAGRSRSCASPLSQPPLFLDDQRDASASLHVNEGDDCMVEISETPQNPSYNASERTRPHRSNSTLFISDHFNEKRDFSQPGVIEFTQTQGKTLAQIIKQGPPPISIKNSLAARADYSSSRLVRLGGRNFSQRSDSFPKSREGLFSSQGFTQPPLSPLPFSQSQSNIGALRNSRMSKFVQVIHPPPVNPYLPTKVRKKPTTQKPRHNLRLNGKETISQYIKYFEEIATAGEGAFSTVYRARSRTDGCTYAIKKRKRPLMSRANVGDSVRTSELREVLALAALSSCPHILQYRTAWTEEILDEDYLYIQCELAWGSVEDVAMRRRPTGSSPFFLSLPATITQGLSAEDGGVSYRSVHASNSGCLPSESGFRSFRFQQLPNPDGIPDGLSGTMTPCPSNFVDHSHISGGPSEGALASERSHVNPNTSNTSVQTQIPPPLSNRLKVRKRISSDGTFENSHLFGSDPSHWDDNRPESLDDLSNSRRWTRLFSSPITLPDATPLPYSTDSHNSPSPSKSHTPESARDQNKVFRSNSSPDGLPNKQFSIDTKPIGAKMLVNVPSTEGFPVEPTTLDFSESSTNANQTGDEALLSKQGESLSSQLVPSNEQFATSAHSSVSQSISKPLSSSSIRKITSFFSQANKKSTTSKSHELNETFVDGDKADEDAATSNGNARTLTNLYEIISVPTSSQRMKDNGYIGVSKEESKEQKKPHASLTTRKSHSKRGRSTVSTRAQKARGSGIASGGSAQADSYINSLSAEMNGQEKAEISLTVTSSKLGSNYLTEECEASRDSATSTTPTRKQVTLRRSRRIQIGGGRGSEVTDSGYSDLSNSYSNSSHKGNVTQPTDAAATGLHNDGEMNEDDSDSVLKRPEENVVNFSSVRDLVKDMSAGAKTAAMKMASAGNNEAGTKRTACKGLQSDTSICSVKRRNCGRNRTVDPLSQISQSQSCDELLVSNLVGNENTGDSTNFCKPRLLQFDALSNSPDRHRKIGLPTHSIEPTSQQTDSQMHGDKRTDLGCLPDNSQSLEQATFSALKSLNGVEKNNSEVSKLQVGSTKVEKSAAKSEMDSWNHDSPVPSMFVPRPTTSPVDFEMDVPLGTLAMQTSPLSIVKNPSSINPSSRTHDFFVCKALSSSKNEMEISSLRISAPDNDPVPILSPLDLDQSIHTAPTKGVPLHQEGTSALKSDVDAPVSLPPEGEEWNFMTQASKIRSESTSLPPPINHKGVLFGTAGAHGMNPTPAKEAECVNRYKFHEIDILLIMKHIATALAFMHCRGLAHLDVKPANILVTYEGGANLCSQDGEWVPEAASLGGVPSIDRLVWEEAIRLHRLSLQDSHPSESIEHRTAFSSRVHDASPGEGAVSNTLPTAQDVDPTPIRSQTPLSYKGGSSEGPVPLLTRRRYAVSPYGTHIPTATTTTTSNTTSPLDAGARMSPRILQTYAQHDDTALSPNLDTVDLAIRGGDATNPQTISAASNPYFTSRSPTPSLASAQGLDITRLMNIGRVVYKLGDLGQAASVNEVDPFEGDARYLSIEILQGESISLTSSDIFALGISLFELASGINLPKDGEEYHKLRKYPLPRDAVSHLSCELHALLAQMCHPMETSRPSAQDILDLPIIKNIREPPFNVRHTLYQVAYMEQPVHSRLMSSSVDLSHPPFSELSGINGPSTSSPVESYPPLSVYYRPYSCPHPCGYPCGTVPRPTSCASTRNSLVESINVSSSCAGKPVRSTSAMSAPKTPTFSKKHQLTEGDTALFSTSTRAKSPLHIASPSVLPSPTTLEQDIQSMKRRIIEHGKPVKGGAVCALDFENENTLISPLPTIPVGAPTSLLVLNNSKKGDSALFPRSDLADTVDMDYYRSLEQEEVSDCNSTFSSGQCIVEEKELGEFQGGIIVDKEAIAATLEFDKEAGEITSEKGVQLEPTSIQGNEQVDVASGERFGDSIPLQQRDAFEILKLIGSMILKSTSHVSRSSSDVNDAGHSVLQEKADNKHAIRASFESITGPIKRGDFDTDRSPPSPQSLEWKADNKPLADTKNSQPNVQPISLLNSAVDATQSPLAIMTQVNVQRPLQFSNTSSSQIRFSNSSAFRSLSRQALSSTPTNSETCSQSPVCVSPVSLSARINAQSVLQPQAHGNESTALLSSPAMSNHDNLLPVVIAQSPLDASKSNGNGKEGVASVTPSAKEVIVLDTPAPSSARSSFHTKGARSATGSIFSPAFDDANLSATVISYSPLLQKKSTFPIPGPMPPPRGETTGAFNSSKVQLKDKPRGNWKNQTKRRLSLSSVCDTSRSSIQSSHLLEGDNSMPSCAQGEDATSTRVLDNGRADFLHGFSQLCNYPSDELMDESIDDADECLLTDCVSQNDDIAMTKTHSRSYVPTVPRSRNVFKLREQPSTVAHEDSAQCPIAGIEQEGSLRKRKDTANEQHYDAYHGANVTNKTFLSTNSSSSDPCVTSPSSEPKITMHGTIINKEVSDDTLSIPPKDPRYVSPSDGAASSSEILDIQLNLTLDRKTLSKLEMFLNTFNM